jgi:hypothetical protein
MQINPFYFCLWHISNITYSPFQSSNLDSETSCSGLQTILSNFLHKILHRFLFHSLYVLRVHLCTHLKIVSLSITCMIWSTSLALDGNNSTVISKVRASASPLFFNGEAVWAGRASRSKWGSIRNKKGAEMWALPRSRLHSLPVQAILPPLHNLQIQWAMAWLDLNRQGEGMD